MTADAPEVHEIEGVLISLPRDSSERVRIAMSTGSYERAEREALRRVLRPNDVVMELGTGLGLLSVYCAKVVGSEDVFTYEANPGLEPDIRRTFELNGASPTLTIAMLGARDGEVEFFVHQDFWSSSAIRDGDRAKRVMVPVRPINEEVCRIKPTLLIADIEGGEYDLFQILDLRGIETIVLEVHEDVLGRTKVRALIKRILLAGFRIDHDGSSSNVVVFGRSAVGSSGREELSAEIGRALAKIPSARARVLARKRRERELEALVRARKRRLKKLIPRNSRFLLVDSSIGEQDRFIDHARLHFPDYEGQAGGPPIDDVSAIRELERARHAGAQHFFIAGPDYWWLNNYPAFFTYLRRQYLCLVEDDQLLGFDLRSPQATPGISMQEGVSE